MIFKLEINEIPDILLKEEDKSNHASTMFNIDTNNISIWFKTNLIMPRLWTLDHPDDVPPNASNRFNDYIQNFNNNGYKVWDIQYNQHATSYLQLTSKKTSECTLISGRADYLITSNQANKANYLYEILCVIEIQSKDDEELCINQMLTYLLILMNTKNLKQLIGFLIYSNGLCRAFKATRGADGNCMYEQNDLFHLTYIFQIFQSILSSTN